MLAAQRGDLLRARRVGACARWLLDREKLPLTGSSRMLFARFVTPVLDLDVNETAEPFHVGEDFLDLAFGSPDRETFQSPR